MRHRLPAAALILTAVVVLMGGYAHAQSGSGRTVRTFFDALAAGDIDGALALLSSEIELLPPDGGDPLQGQEAVRAWLLELPQPIAVRWTLPWGGRKYEAHVTAGDTPLTFVFDGASGTIIHIDVSYDDGAPPPPPPAVATPVAPDTER